MLLETTPTTAKSKRYVIAKRGNLVAILSDMQSRYAQAMRLPRRPLLYPISRSSQ
jgi:hypothetical protein